MDWQLDYVGKDLDEDQAELILNTRWPEKERRLEPELFACKWWDARPYHPVISTYLFAHLFTEQTRKIIRAHIDDRPPRVTASGKVIDWQPLRRDIFEAPKGSPRQVKAWERKLFSLIRARQFADAYGIPYGFFVRASLRAVYFGRIYLLEHTKLPDPGQLNGEEMRSKILAAWVEELGARIQAATHPRYLLVNDVGHPDVAAHQDWLIAQLKRRPDPRFGLRKFIGAGLLDPKRAAQAFGEARVSQATLNMGRDT